MTCLALLIWLNTWSVATHTRVLVDCLRRTDADDAERVLVLHIRRTQLELSGHREIFG